MLVQTEAERRGWVEDAARQARAVTHKARRCGLAGQARERSVRSAMSHSEETSVVFATMLPR
jgi:hypothetical protein